MLHWLDARQERPGFRFHHVEEEHECPHCSTCYRGLICPQCGMRYATRRMTPRTIMHKVLDICGFDEYGNHNILLTMRDLLWRPGYMIRDYLNGHSVAYFQPFKLLFLLVVVFTVLLHVIGVEPDNNIDIGELIKKLNEDENTRPMKPIFEAAAAVIQWFRENVAYSIILQNIFIVTAMWKVYRKRVPYTWTETFVAQMYICCQFMMLAIVQLLLTWRYKEAVLFSYFVSTWVVIPVMLYDFYQLYGERKLWAALWRFIKIGMWLLLQYISAFAILILALIIYMIIWAAMSGKLNDLS